MIAALALVVGLLVGLASGGTVRGLAALRLRGESFVIVGFVLQGIARGRIIGTNATSWGLAAWLAVTVALAVLLLASYRAPGAAVTAAGLLLNADVVIANHAMPVFVGTASVSPGEVLTRSAGFYQLVQPGTLLTFLGDVIRLELFQQRLLLSVGDVVMAVGVIVLVCGAMTSGTCRSSTLALDS